nr:hypothetical protein CFP56_11245 [Quercus suber]
MREQYSIAARDIDHHEAGVIAQGGGGQHCVPRESGRGGGEFQRRWRGKGSLRIKVENLVLAPASCRLGSFGRRPAQRLFDDLSLPHSFQRPSFRLVHFGWFLGCPVFRRIARIDPSRQTLSHLRGKLLIVPFPSSLVMHAFNRHTPDVQNREHQRIRQQNSSSAQDWETEFDPWLGITTAMTPNVMPIASVRRPLPTVHTLLTAKAQTSYPGSDWDHATSSSFPLPYQIPDGGPNFTSNDHCFPAGYGSPTFGFTEPTQAESQSLPFPSSTSRGYPTPPILSGEISPPIPWRPRAGGSAYVTPEPVWNNWVPSGDSGYQPIAGQTPVYTNPQATPNTQGQSRQSLGLPTPPSTGPRTSRGRHAPNATTAEHVATPDGRANQGGSRHGRQMSEPIIR